MSSCINDVWKDYEWVEITHSIIHYLFAINELVSEKWYARAVDIANNLNITAWSCSISIKNLLKKWFIKEDENKFIKLSIKWNKIVKSALYKREVLINFFENSLWLNSDISNSEACKIEHLISDEVIEKIKEKF